MTTAAVNASRDSADVDGRTRWISGPLADLTIGCGAWSAPLLALTFALDGRYSAQLAIGFYALALFSNYPHFYATVYRIYGSRGELARYRHFALHATVLLVVAALLAHLVPFVAPFLFTAYITWSPWHYSGQNFGIAMMFARRNGAQPTRADRNWLLTAFVASYLMVFVTLHSGVSAEPYVVSLGIPNGVGQFMRILLFLLFVGAAVRSMMPLVRASGVRALAAPLTILVTQFLWFCVPTFLEIAFDARIPRTSYSASILAFMHGAQYLWITSYFTRREAERDEGRQWRPLVYYATLVVGGIALFLPGPWLVSSLFHRDFTSSFLIFTALVNIHHFVLDGVVWKLRDGRIASLLVGGKAASSAAKRGVERAARSLPGWLTWFAGASPVARAVRVAAVSLLLALAGIDVTRYVLAHGTADLGRLATAAVLTPSDAAVRARLASVYSKEGRTDEAIAELRRAVSLDPYDAGSQRALARMLVEAGRGSEALEQHREMMKYISADPDTLVNYGFLAMQSGSGEEAISAWKRAVALDDEQPLAYFYLGNAYEAKGSLKEAMSAYERYLVLAVDQRFRSSFNVLQAMRAALVVGDGYTLDGKVREAGEYYRRVASLAERSGEKGYLAAALGRLGPLYGDNGNVAEAVSCFTRAIRLSREVGDERGESMIWFNYGKLLGSTQGSARLAAACLLRADDGLKDEESKDHEAVRVTLGNYETNFGRLFLPNVRNDLDDLLAQALAYTPT